MNNMQKIKAMKPFKNAIHGWAFCNTDMLADRIEAGQKALNLIPNELKGEAMQTLNAMANALVDLRSRGSK